VTANGAASGNKNKKGRRKKKQELFVEAFRFCLHIPISSNYPHLTFWVFLNKDYLHPSLVELQQLIASGLTNPASVPTRHLNSPMAVVPTIQPVARHGLPYSGASCIAWAHTRTQTHAILSTIFLASVRAQYTLPTLGIQLAVPKARKEPSEGPRL